MAREYEVKLTRTTVEETTITVEAHNQINAACAAGLRAASLEDWQSRSVSVQVSEALWKQGGE